MTFLNSLAPAQFARIEEYLKPKHFPQGTCIIKQGDQGDGCYFIDQGLVRVEFDSGETDTDIVLRYLEPGSVLGEFSLIDQEPRSAYAYAHTDVHARWLSRAGFDTIRQQHPEIANTLLTAFCGNLIGMVRQYTRQVADLVISDEYPAAVNQTVAQAVMAQKAFESWPEERVEALLRDIVSVMIDHVQELAERTVAESGFGVVADKVTKIRFASEQVYQLLAGRPGTGVISFDHPKGLTEIAAPMGVVLGIIPLTNPVSTIVFKTLICLKSRNALILSCHHNISGVGNRTTELIQSVLDRNGAPVNLVQAIRERVSRKTTNLYMRHPGISFILATGGPSVVKAAYSSGTPAIGVGTGNAPVLVCRDADLDTVAGYIVSSKSFDNGVICGSENNLVVTATVRDAFIAALIRHGAAILASDEIVQFSERVFDAAAIRLRREWVGQSAQRIAAAGRVHRDYDIRLLVVPVDHAALDGPYGKEKLAPVLSLFTVFDEAQGMELCRQILANEGMGHTAIIHSRNQEWVQEFGREMPASRVLVNCPGSQGCIGIASGLPVSLTLGCGTWGGTSTTDNVGLRHVMNIKRIALAL